MPIVFLYFSTIFVRVSLKSDCTNKQEIQLEKDAHLEGKSFSIICFLIGQGLI